MISINAPDKTIVNFPDGTDDQTIKAVMAKNYPPTEIQQPALSSREQTAQRIAASDYSDIEKNLEIGAQLGIGPVVDFAAKVLSPPESYTRAVSNTMQALPDVGAGRAFDTVVEKIGEQYNRIPQRGRDALEAVGLPVSLAAGVITPKRALSASKGTLAARRSDAIMKDVQPGVTKIAPAREAAGHSKEIPVMGGMWKKTVETPDPFEVDAANEVAKIKGYNIKGSNLSKHNAVNNAIGEEAVRLRGALKKENFSLVEDVPESIPTTKNEFGNVVQGQPIPAHVRNKFEPVLEKVKSDISSLETLAGDAQTVASKVFDKTKELMAKNPPTLEGLLNVRQEIDKWARLSDKKFFDKTGARQYAVREIREAINNFIDANAQSVAVKESLKKQSSLYRAKDVLQEKAAEDMRGKALDAAAPSTLKNRAKNVVKHGASYVGISK